MERLLPSLEPETYRSWAKALAIAPSATSPNLETPNMITFSKIEDIALRISKARPPAGLLSQKSKRHRSPNLESQIPDRIACSKTEEAPLSQLQEPDLLG
ncbi:hypothetical protein ACFX19_032410 [Malus domestica]